MSSTPPLTASAAGLALAAFASLLVLHPVRAQPYNAPDASAAPAASAGMGADPIGAITLAVGGEEQTFAVIGEVRSEHAHWGSGWTIQGNELYLTLWGVAGSPEDAKPSSDAVVLRLTFYADRDLAHECDPMDDRLEYNVGGQRDLLTGDTCAGLEVESIRHDDASDAYIVSGSFHGSLHRSGAEVTAGTFEATVRRSAATEVGVWLRHLSRQPAARLAGWW